MKKKLQNHIPIKESGAKKLLLTMKLALIIFFLSVLHVSANVYSQITVNLDVHDKSIREVLKTIEQQSQVRFFYSDDLLQMNNLIDVKSDNENIIGVLDEIFKGSPLTYKTYENNLIVIAPRQMLQQGQKITGTVTDEKGNLLPGVTVMVKGTTFGTLTDASGKYTFDNEPKNTTLIFSFIGMATQEIATNGQKLVDVVMKEAAIGLDEVVVIGYGTGKKTDLAGSITQVSSTSYKDQPITDINGALQGRAAGVSITSQSGDLNGDFKIRIRGVNSIFNSNDPLYVVDGVALGSVGTAELNVNDIESMDILKDASATAIYGSRGSNGVILITTKRGASGKSTVDYTFSESFNYVPYKFDVLNAENFAKLANTIVPGTFPDPSIYAGKGTDWQKAMEQTGHLQNHQLSFTGGNDKTKYYIAANYIDQNGIAINSLRTKFAIRSNIDAKINEKLSFALNFYGSRTLLHNSGNGIGGANYAPTMPIYDDEANGIYHRLDGIGVVFTTNPVMGNKEANNDGWNNAALINGKVTYKFTDWLTYNLNIGTDMYLNKSAQVTNTYQSPGNPNSSQSSYESLTWQVSNALTFHKLFAGIHDITFTGVTEATSNTQDNFTGGGNGLTSAANGYWNLGLNSSPYVNSGYSKWSLQSYIARLSYSLMDKYLLTATMRADGSSKFQQTKNKWGYFPSIALGWRLSEESFIKDLDIFTNLKLRGSWGITGNQAINPYSSLGLLGYEGYSWGTATNLPGYMPGDPPNPDLKWEETKQTDVGLDIGILKNRVSLSFDYFNKNVENLLLPVPIPKFYGGGTKLSNVGSVNNKGIDMAINFVPVENKDFSWNAQLNFSSYKNKVTSLGADSMIFIGSTHVAKVGYPIGEFWLIPWEGIYQTNEGIHKAGDNKFRDVSRNGSIGLEDQVCAGSPLPKFELGFNNTFKYKNFSLNIFIQAIKGKYEFNGTLLGLASTTGNQKIITYAPAANYWTPTNTGSQWPDLTSVTSQNYDMSGKWLQDASYVRFKNISLAYTIPKTVLNFASLQFSVSLQNWITFTKWVGYDPESGSGGDADAGGDSGLPNPKSVTFTLHASF